MSLSSQARRRLVVGGVVLSLAAWGVDTMAPTVTDAVRDAAAGVVTPVQDRLTLRSGGEAARLKQQRDAARRALAQRGDHQALRRGLDRMLGSASTAERRVVPARVVAFTPPGARGDNQRVTIDAGARDGIQTQQTVVTGDGLVGRTVQVRAGSADVEVVTSPGTVVGARVHRSQAMGSLAATQPPAVPRRAPGELTLSFVAQGDVRAGDVVRTLGSMNERPYVRDVVIGQVTAVDPDRGQLGRTARVRPAVDVSALDVVGVIQPERRVLPRPTLTGTGAP